MPPVISARLKVALKTRSRRPCSMRLLALTRMAERTHSKAPMAASRKTMISVSMPSVERLPLVITRS